MKTTYKQYSTTVEPLGERKMGFVISTAAVDRDGDTVDPKGWDLGSYTKNPVVLWAHDYAQPPVGKAVNIQATKDGLRADVEFLPQGMSPFADMIHDMCKTGFLNATSVGFRGMEADPAKDRKGGYDFKKQELLEFSIVPVPSNPEALALRGGKSDQVQRYAKAMRHWTKDILGDEAPKLDAEQFENLADAIAKAMKDPEPKVEDKKTDVATLDYTAIAVEVAKLLKPAETKDISTDVLNIEQVDAEIDWDGIKFVEDEPTLDAEAVSKMLLDGVRETIREMASASAQAAVNRMTGRLD
jgi:HK97 family phage prohead protease